MSRGPDVQPLIDYYAREGYYRHVQTICKEVLKKRANDPVLRFWKTFGVCMEGGSGPNQAIREFEELQNSVDVKVASSAACLHAHKLCRLVDQEAVEMLELKVQSDQARAKPSDLLQAASFYCHVGQFNDARDLVNNVLEREQNNQAAQNLRGWVDLLCGREAMANKSIRYFESANGISKNITSLLGIAKFYQKKRTRSEEEKERNLKEALENLMSVVAQFSWFLPALIEETKVLMIMGQWDQALDTAQRVLAQDARNIEALRFNVMHLLIRESNYQAATTKMQELAESISTHEQQNAMLYFKVAHATARVAGRHPDILGLCLRMAQQARQLAPEKSEYAAEVGEQFLMLEDVAQASDCFREATRLDESNMEAHYGIIKCQILESKLDDAEQQLEFLNEIQMSVGGSAGLSHLSSLLAWEKHRDMAKSVSLLGETITLHGESVEEVEMGYDYFAALNPDLLIQITKQLMQHCPTEPIPAGEEKDKTLVTGIRVLEMILKDVPGLIEAQLLLAKTKYILNDLEGAQRQIQACLDLNPNYSEANVILAQIYLSEDQYTDSLNALDQALAYNFEIRETPLYSVVKAKVQESLGELQQAADVLTAALEKPGMHSRGGSGTHERASVFVQLAQVHLKLKNLPEALKVISEAKGLFTGTPEEMRVMITDCDIAIARGDFRGAVARLKMIPKESPHFVKARTSLADVYLNHRNDKKRYLECYEELAAQSPSAKTSIALGEACLKVNEPEKAIECFVQALTHDKADTGLRSKIGKALVFTHDYDKAKTYYKEALQENPKDTGLALELANLCMRLGKRRQGEYQEAAEVLEQARAELGFTDTQSITNNVKVHMMLAKLHKECNNHQNSTEALLQARTLHSRLKGEGTDVKKMGTDICFTLAEYHREYARGGTDKEPNQARALKFYNEALKHDNTHENSLVALAELHKERNELDQCQQQCVTLLRIDPANDQASVTLAELLFMKKETEAAIYHFQQLLEKRPNYHVALEKLITLLRHAGKLSEATRYLEMAERVSVRASRDPGLMFCKGLHHKYSNNLQDALLCMARARKDSRWGTAARYHMIDIYLDPNKDAFLGEEGGGEVQATHISDARRLIEEIPRRKPEDIEKVKILECYCQMATGNKLDVEAASKKLQEMVGTQMEHVPAMLGVSVAFVVLKQTPKARNMLKRIVKLEYRPDNAEEFERSWLMLADLYVHSGKYDLAQDLCKRCLTHNQSCGKAWEYLGLVMEKEQSYADAADAYEHAWKYESERSASVGFKLAFNYLKAKRFVDAIDICHRVIEIDPTYPKIKKDILDLARKSLRN